MGIEKLKGYVFKHRNINHKPNICIITAIYGNYEKSCKPVCPQSINYDKICFSNTRIEETNGWEIDTEPYHLINNSKLDTGDYVNSINNNKHTFNIAKYYKQNFHNIPKLKKYDIVIWMDGTIEIKNPYFLEYFSLILRENKIVTFEHEKRRGELKREVNASNNPRYTSTNWNGQDQPYQDIFAQFENYKKDGYSDAYWKKYSESNNYGLWITCVVGFNMNEKETIDFLDYWYLQTLKFTTQDQIGFPYALQKLKIHPYSFPDNFVKMNTNHQQNEFYVKHAHGK